MAFTLYNMMIQFSLHNITVLQATGSWARAWNEATNEACMLFSAAVIVIFHSVYNSSPLPSLSRMLTVTASPPGTNMAGIITLPERTKFSVPSRSWSSVILIANTWTLLPLVPWSNVMFVSNVSVECAREKSSPSVRSVIQVT